MVAASEKLSSILGENAISNVWLSHRKSNPDRLGENTHQTFANGSNTYLKEQMKKHRHQIEKLEFLIKW